MKEKQKRHVAVYRFDEHNGAFFFWHKARLKGAFRAPLDLFHIDAHSDMGRPNFFRSSLYALAGPDALDYYEKFSRDELNIQNFIYPAVLSGVVRNVYFFYPRWREFRPAKGIIQVGSAFGEGKIIKYPNWLDKKNHQKTVQKALPDLKKFFYRAGSINQMPRRRTVILDIDLDYFACRDSVQNNRRFRLRITGDQFRDRKAFLRDESIRLSGLEFTFKKEKRQPVVIIGFQKVPEKAHLPAHDEIRKEADLLVQTLGERSVRPAVITLCRSRISGYCPAEYASAVEAVLIKRLSELYTLHLEN